LNFQFAANLQIENTLLQDVFSVGC
jgi:hypothetical protein